MTAPTNVRTCYRHPDRVAGITCQRCDRPICPSCMHQASVGFHCPECSRTGRQQVYQGVPRTAAGRPVLTQVLIGLNVAVFLLDVVLTGAEAVMGTGGLSVLGREGALWSPITSVEPWRLLTSGFLHAGIVHLGFNMWMLWILGRMLEPALGRLRYGAVYLGSLLAGSLGVTVFDVMSGLPARSIAPTVGASGAIFGLMGAVLVVARHRRVSLAHTGIVPTIVINLVFTLTIPGISIGGHVGGLIGGLICGFLAVEVPPRVRSSQPDVLAAGAAVAAGVVSAAVAYGLSAATWGI